MTVTDSVTAPTSQDAVGQDEHVHVGGECGDEEGGRGHQGAHHRDGATPVLIGQGTHYGTCDTTTRVV